MSGYTKDTNAQFLDLSRFETSVSKCEVRFEMNQPAIFTAADGTTQPVRMPGSIMHVDVELEFIKNPWLRIHEGYTMLEDKNGTMYCGFIKNPVMNFNDDGSLKHTKFTVSQALPGTCWSGAPLEEFRGK